MGKSRHIRQLGIVVYSAIVLSISTFVVKANWHLWTLSSQSYQGIGSDVMPQMSNIKQRLVADEGDRMQQFFLHR